MDVQEVSGCSWIQTLPQLINNSNAPHVICGSYVKINASGFFLMATYSIIFFRW